jgi:hypothetical protein
MKKFNSILNEIFKIELSLKSYIKKERNRIKIVRHFIKFVDLFLLKPDKNLCEERIIRKLSTKQNPRLVNIDGLFIRFVMKKWIFDVSYILPDLYCG